MLLKAYQNEQTLREVCVDPHVQILPLLPKHALNSVERKLLLTFKRTWLTPPEIKSAITSQSHCFRLSEDSGRYQLRSGNLCMAYVWPMKQKLRLGAAERPRLYLYLFPHILLKVKCSPYLMMLRKVRVYSPNMYKKLVSESNYI